MNIETMFPIKCPRNGIDFYNWLKSHPENNIAYTDCDDGGCAFIESMLSAHIWSYRSYFHNWCLNLRKRFNDKKIKDEWYGDMDLVIKLIHQTDDKTVFHLKDNSSYADINNWIIIHDFSDTYYSVHIRQLHEKGDYPKSAYPKKLNKKFWKDRNYICDYVEKYHMTKLGSVYGDIRDIGYVVSYKDVWLAESRFPSFDGDYWQRYYFYSQFKEICFKLHIIESQINEESEDKKE